METNPLDWVAAAEKIVKNGLGWSVVILVISSSVLFAFEHQWITSNEQTAYVLYAAQLLFVIAGALLGIALTVFIFRIVVWLIIAPIKAYHLARGRQAEFEREQQRMRENAMMTNRESRLVLLAYTMRDSGRFRAPNLHPILDELYNVSLIRTEGPVISAGYRPGQLMRVHPLMWERGDATWLRNVVRNDFPEFKTHDDLASAINDALRQLEKVNPFYG